MARAEPAEPVARPVCEFCGFPIEAADQECVARDEGVCRE